VKAYTGIEAAFYRINRYQDEFAERFVQLRELLSKIYGLCYSIFAANEDYLAAFFLHRISEKVLTYGYDVVNRIFCDNNMHHDWRVPGHKHQNPTLKDLFEMFKSVQGRRKLPLEERLVLILRVCGNRFYYKNEHESALKMIAEHNKAKDVEKISVAHIKKILEDHCQEIKSDDEGLDRYCMITGQCESEIRKAEKDKKVTPQKKKAAKRLPPKKRKRK
jgi:hypothetical protein